MSRAPCPDVRTLEALVVAESSVAAADELTDHLETCVDCQNALRTLAADNSLWDDAAQGLGDAAREEPALRELVEQLKSDGPAAMEELAFLRPSEKPGVVGLLGPYEVLEEIGRGGMGVVLKAIDPTLNRVVAIKVLSPFLACSATARLRFTREARSAAAVCHDHIVTVHAVTELDGLPYMVMQYVAGESLQARLDRGVPLELKEIVCIGWQTASALAAAHAQGLIHRDIKPANLLLENGLARVKITDFGLARTADDMQLTREGVVAGTPEYMSPEQARGEPVDHRTDVFSLGGVLYALCTGSPPFQGASTVAVLRQVSDDQPTAIRVLNPEVPEWLEALIARLMAKDPAGRFQSAAEVARLLEAYSRHLSQPASIPVPEFPSFADTRAVSGIERTARSRRMRRLVPSLLTLTAAVFGLAMLLWFVADKDAAKPAVKEAANPHLREHVVYDFRQELQKLPPCTLFGPDLESVVSTDAKGLRIKRGSDYPNQLTGVDIPLVLRGDFDVSMGYEILEIGKPVPHYGAGLALRVMLGEPVTMTAVVSRSRKPAGEQFGAFKIITDAEGKNRYDTSRETKATSSSGRLRLVRIGSKVRFFFAEAPPAYTFMQSAELGSEDVHLIRLYTNSTNGRVLLDVRFTDLDIQADTIIRSKAAATPALGVPENRRSRTSLKVVGILAVLLLIALGGSLGVWLIVRRSQQDADGASVDSHQESTEAVPPAQVVPCSGCGTKLRAKPELAGRKIKCPACGGIVLLPAMKQTNRPAR